MKTCPSCKEPNEIDAKFCVRCGNEFVYSLSANGKKKSNGLKKVSSKLWKLFLLITFLWIVSILLYNYLIAELKYKKSNIPYGAFSFTFRGKENAGFEEEEWVLLKGQDGSLSILNLQNPKGKLLRVGKEEIKLELKGINLLKIESTTYRGKEAELIKYEFVDIKQINKPFVFKNLPPPDEPLVRLLGEVEDTRWAPSRQKKQCIFEIREDGIFQKTGSVKWRFFDWGIIGGSKAKLDISNDKDANRVFERFRFPKKATAYIPPPFETSTIYCRV